jgi:hypothetical protein
MALFKKNKVEEARRLAEEAKKREMGKIVEMSRIQLPKREGFAPYTTEYSDFLKEIKQKPTSLYEIACAKSEKLLSITPNAQMKIKLTEDLKTSYINATPGGVLSFAIIITIILSLVSLSSLLFLGFTIGLFAFFFTGLVFYFFYNYPSNQSKVMQLRMSADSVLAILYMVIYMRSSPNLEGALKFAAQNLDGPLSWDLRKLLWDMEVGVYPSADSAITNYIFKWKDKNKEFAESLHLLRGVAVEPGRREIVFDETINVILIGTKEKAKHYASNLRTPMMLIHALGILLPVMGLVLFPVVLIFMADSVKPIFIFFAYDILLPIALLFFINYTLQSKPPTFSQPDISKAKSVPPLGKFKLGNAFLPVWPISLIIAFPFLLIGYVGLASPSTYTAVNFSILIIFGMALGISSYGFLDSYQKMKIRKDVEKIENEFSVALFQLGNTLSGGIPLEIAVDRARENLKNLKISEMFEIISLNMKKFGYTFEQALFDKEVGAIWYYPSKLIHSIMQTVLESSRKSIATAANSMIVISNYLKGMHDVKEEIDEILGETVSSMKFLAMFLAPLVAGVTVTMAVIIIEILKSLGATVGSLLGGQQSMNAAQLAFLVPSLAGGGLPITPSAFQIIVGIYMIETAVLLSLFLNRIQYGEDAIGERSLMSKIVMIGVVVYFLSWIAVFSMFGGTIQTLLTQVPA